MGLGFGGVVAALLGVAIARAFKGSTTRLPPLDLSTIAFRPAKMFRAGPPGGRQIDVLVIHTSENTETPTTAEAVAAYFANPRDAHGNPVTASAHYSVDNNSIVQSVKDRDIAFAAPPMNDRGLHVEFGGWAKQTPEEWHDAYSKAQLELAARLFAAKAKAYAVPLVWLDEAALLAGGRGITTHAIISRAFKVPGGHQDPGPNFPRDEFMELVRSVDA